nr:putative invertase inhibitor [Ipomoea batatas]
MASPLFLLSISLFPFIIHGAKENHQVIQNTCKTINAYQFADYDFCVSTLQARPARECATLLRIGWTSIELLMSNVTDTRRHIKGVLKSGKVQHWAMPCVTECYDRYNTAEILVESCLWKYRHTDFVNANFYAVALINSMVFCEEAFQKGRSAAAAAGCRRSRPEIITLFSWLLTLSSSTMADNSSENARYRLHFGYGFVAIQNGNIYARNSGGSKINLITARDNKPGTVNGGLYIQNCTSALKSTWFIALGCDYVDFVTTWVPSVYVTVLNDYDAVAEDEVYMSQSRMNCLPSLKKRVSW